MERVPTFAGRCRPAFALAVLVAGGTIGVAACSSGSGVSERTFDATPPPPPGPCVVTRTESPFCRPGDAAVAPDAATDAPADAGTDAPATGTIAPPESENRCLVTMDTSLACPSAVAALAMAPGKDGATEIVVAQRGLAHTTAQGFLANDVNAYLQHVHVGANGEARVTPDPIAPYPGTTESGGIPQDVQVLPASAGRDAALLVFAAAADGASSLRAGPLVPGAPVALGAAVPVDASYAPRAFTSPSGEGFVALRPAASSAAVSLVRGLPDAPRVIRSQVDASWFVATTDPAGVPAGLFFDGSMLTLREGDAFDRVRWSQPFETRSGSPSFDLVYHVPSGGGAVPVVLSDDGEQAVVQLLRDGAPSPPPSAVVGKSFSTCPRSTYIGVTCDACPVSKQCETGEDQLHTLRMFSANGRLFVVYVSTDVRHTMGYALDKTPIVGVGCVCSLVTRDTREFADSLVLVEIVPGAKPSDVPTVVEHMRVPLSAAHATGFVSLMPRYDGDVDVIVGDPLSGFTGDLTAWPKTSTLHRALRVSTAGL